MNPSADSTLEGWSLIASMVEHTPPSTEFSEFLYYWCQQFRNCGTPTAPTRPAIAQQRRSTTRLGWPDLHHDVNVRGAPAIWSRTRRRTEATVKLDRVMH